MHFPLPLADPLPLSSPRLWILMGLMDGLLLVLAYLSQRENTRPLRLAIAPLVYVVVWHLTGGIAFEQEIHQWFNYVIGMGGCYVVLLVPRLACLSTPYTHPRPPPSTTIDLLTNPSLAGWNETPYYKPSPTVKPPFRSAAQHALVAVRDAGALFALSLLARPFDLLLDLRGASLWDLEGQDVPWLPSFVPHVHPLHKYVAAVGVTAIFGFCVYLFVEIIYHAWASASIALGWSPQEFGEVFDRPWLATSMHEFWGRRWHPLFSPTFAFYSKPFPALLKPAVVFLVSGLIHDLGALPFKPNELSPEITAFFFVQTFALLAERTWSKLGFGRVGGWLGRIWTVTWVIGTGIFVVEGWLQKGLLGMAVRTFWNAAGVDKY